MVFSSFSCGSGTTIKNKKAEPTETAENKIGELAEQLDGLWLSDSYLKNIEKTKSVYQSKKYTTEILGFHLDKKVLLTDSAFLEGFTDHEGGYDSPLKYDKSLGKFINDIPRLSEYAIFPDPFELSLTGNKNLEMYFPNSKKTDTYRKADSDFESEIRKVLIAGKYQLGKAKVQFDNDGKVHDFQGFNHYDVVADFGEGIEYDAIVFYKNAEGGNWSEGEMYAFKFVGTSLHLQKVKTNWETLDHKIGSKILVLEKLNK